MKAIVCEMCDGRNVVKQDGMYVCQSCGTKYSVEEAKKLMVEVGDAPIPAAPVTRSAPSSELDNLYTLARRARNDNNSENAKKYYEMILPLDPNSWEANFFTIFYQAMTCKIAEIQSAANRMTNCEDTCLKLVKDNISDPEEAKKAVTLMADKCIEIAGILNVAATNHYNGISDSIRNNYTQEMINNRVAARDICYHFGDNVIGVFGDEYGKDIACRCWKSGIEIHKFFIKHLADKESNKNVVLSYASKIQKFEPDYVAPEIDTTKSGCYVATAIYGSYDCPEVWTLRRYRDNTLAATWYGRAFIRIYYALSPTLVRRFGKTEWFKNMWKPKLDHMVMKLRNEGVEDTPYQDKTW